MSEAVHKPISPLCLSEPNLNEIPQFTYARGQEVRTIRECELEKLVLDFVRSTMTMSGRKLAELHEEARRLGIKP